MRVAIVVAVACLSVAGFCAEQDAKASIKKSTNIPAQDLALALKTLAYERGFQLVFRSEVVGAKQTQGAMGELTTTEALTRLLEGTSLVYSYLNDKTVTIEPDNSNSKSEGRRPSAGISQQCSGLSSTNLNYATSLNETGSGSTHWSGLEEARDCVESYSQQNRVLPSAIAAAEAEPVPKSDGESNVNKDATASTGLEEVVVTAEKRSMNIQSVPISITAFKADQLENLQIKSLVDLTNVVPNLTLRLSGSGGELVPVFSIRGINSANAAPSQDGPVAVYYDEVYKGNADLLGVGVFDLDRVEVLKGPQGTLYGKNSTGGAINFISRVPDFSTESNLTVGFGNYSHFHAEGGAQTAMRDAVAVRLAFTTDRAEGWQTNTAPDAPNAASTDYYALRGTMLVKPTDSSSVILRAWISRANPIGVFRGWYPTTAQGIGSPAYPALGSGGVLLEPLTNGNKRDGYDPSPKTSNLRTNALSATVGLKLTESLDLGSITSWDRGVLALRNPSFTKLKLLTNNYYTNTIQFSEDLRLTSHYSGPFNFILGAYYNREDVHARQATVFLGDIDVDHDGIVNAADCIAGGFANTACSHTNQFEQIKKSAALYTDESYILTDQFKVHAGLRYTHDRGELSSITAYTGDVNYNSLLNTIPGPGNANLSPHFANSNLSGRFGVDYNVTNDILLYASYGRGYRGAAFNDGAYYKPAEVNVAPAESLTSYEVGFKTEAFEHRVRFNGAIFDMEYRNQQVMTRNTVTNANLLVSLGRSRTRGGEFELDVKGPGGLTLFSSLGVLNTRILQGRVNGVDVSGRPLASAASITASAGLDWEQSLGDHVRANLHVDEGYTGRQRYDFNNDPRTIIGGHGLLNGRLRFSDPSDRLGVTLWGKNLLNRYYAEFISNLGFIRAVNELPNAPRMYGVAVDAKF